MRVHHRTLSQTMDKEPSMTLRTRIVNYLEGNPGTRYTNAQLAQDSGSSAGERSSRFAPGTAVRSAR
jgi:hypothetical protein